MKIGFTGTSQGMTSKQKAIVRNLLLGEEELHHGDCIGADAEVHEIANGFKILVVIHPPTNPKARAFCEAASETREPLPYLDRNHVIVDETDALVAAPRGPEVQRSGTWATIRYALKQGKPVFIVLPDGSLKS
jgi:hypothetical protein